MESVPFTETSSYASSPRLNAHRDSKSDVESGYASGASSTSESTMGLPQITLTKVHLEHLNQQLERLSAQDRLKFCKAFFPNLYQTTAFGLTGLVTLDMLSKLQEQDPESQSVDMIFLDTLYHFQETHELIDRVAKRYPNVPLHIFKPAGLSTAVEFEDKYGVKFYEVEAEQYDWIAKVEPQQRSYVELNVAAVLTGRRRSQGGQRDKIGIIEVDDERGIIKINPLVDWSFKQVKDYITENNVPYNVLLDRGYKSVGDWHSTSPVKEGEDERAGRWRGQEKTECGIHNKKSRYAQFLEEQARKAREEQLDAALHQVELERVGDE